MRKRPLFFAFLAICAGIWICETLLPNHIKNFTTTGEIYLTANIVTDPVHKTDAYGRAAVTFTAEAVSIGKAQSSARGLVNVTSYDEKDAALEYGDYILIKGNTSRLRAPYLARRGIYSAVTVNKSGFISVIKKGSGSCFTRNIFRFKNKLRILIREHLPGAEGDVLTGVLLGERSAIENDLKGRFVQTGTVHILAISGLHVGIIAAIFILMSRFFYVPVRVTYIVVPFLLIAYAVLTGANTPVTRATLMASSVLIGRAFNRKVDILNCLGLAGIFLLLINPKMLFDAGFQLSFATVISIIALAPGLETVLGCDFEKNRVIDYLKRSIAVSLAAWFGIIPIVAYHFNMISPVCILANIPAVFLLSLIVASGLVFLSAGLTAPFLAHFFAGAVEFFIAALIKAVTVFSNMPFAFFRTHPWNTAEIISFYIALAAMGLTLYKKNIRKYHAAIALLVFLNISVWGGVLRCTKYDVRCTVLDVAHGDAIMLEFADGSCALIDAGKKIRGLDMGERVIAPYLLSRRIKRIDAVFTTHNDNDHAGGMDYIIKNFNVKNKFDSYNLKFGDKITGFKGADILVLNPPDERFRAVGSEENENSLVLKVVSGSRSFIFCADIQDQAMATLLAYPGLLKSDVIKVAHHGSSLSGTGEVFLKYIASKIALVSAPAGEVSEKLINQLVESNCAVYITGRDGNITVELNNGKICLKFN